MIIYNTYGIWYMMVDPYANYGAGIFTYKNRVILDKGKCW